MIFFSDLDNRKVNPLIYVKFWRQACLSTLLYGAERFTLTPTLLLRTERCQSWFLKNSFYVAPGPLLQKLSGRNSIESEIAIKKALPLGRLIKQPKMSPAVKSLFDTGQKASFTQILHHWVYCLALQRHCINMSCFITSKKGIAAPHSPFILHGKKLCRIRSLTLRGMDWTTSVNFILI